MIIQAEETVNVDLDELLSYPLQDYEIELAIPVTVCECGHYRCKGYYVKTHIAQDECLFSFMEKGLDLFLPSCWELKNMRVRKEIREIIKAQAKVAIIPVIPIASMVIATIGV